MEEIFYKNYFGGTTVVLSVLRREDNSYSFSVAKYMDKSKSVFIEHCQFGLEEEDFKELIKELSKEVK